MLQSIKTFAVTIVCAMTVFVCRELTKPSFFPYPNGRSKFEVHSVQVSDANAGVDCSGMFRMKNRSFHGLKDVTNSKYKHENKILFYLYPLSSFPSFWGGFCDHRKSKTPKHDHADFALQAMMRHPWRTSDPQEAHLAILPLSLDLWARGGCDKNVTTKRVLAELEIALNNSGVFPTLRHVIIANDFMTSKIVIPFMEMLSPVGIWVGMEGRSNCRTSLGYTSNYAGLSMRNPNHIATPDSLRFGAQRIHSVFFVGQVDERLGYSDRAALFQSTGEISGNPYIISRFKDNVSLHNNLRRCSSINDTDRCLTEVETVVGRLNTQSAHALSNFSLCLRGDTQGSDRWINAMTAGAVLMNVADVGGKNNKSINGDVQESLEWLPFPHAVPWKDLVITIPEEDYTQDPALAITNTMKSISPERQLELQQLSLYYSADLDWTAHNSRVLENMLYEAYTIPCS